MNYDLSPETLKAIVAERDRQDAKWGAGIRGLDVVTWLEVLAEEVGEVARARLEHRNEPEIIKAELIQVAAVAVAAFEDFLGSDQADVLSVLATSANDYKATEPLFVHLLYWQGQAAFVVSNPDYTGYPRMYTRALANIGAIAAVMYQQTGGAA